MASKGNKKTIKDINKIRCPMCGRTRVFSEFYKTSSPLYANNFGLMVFCKDCVIQTFDVYYDILKDVRKAVIVTCMKFDIPFSATDLEGAMKEYANSNEKNVHIFRLYVTKVNSIGSFNNDLGGFDPKFLFPDEKRVDKVAALEAEVKDLSELELTEEEQKIKDDVIRLLGYDPFEGYSIADQKFLYVELLPYLDEDTLEDTFKLSQIIQIVNNNNQVRKIDLVIASLSGNLEALIKNQGEIKNLTEAKKKIVENTDKIAKENSISVKHRGDKSAGKSTLTYLMKNYRELGFEDAEQDYYNQNVAYGMKMVADISHKSIIEQLQFDENDINEMFYTQRQLIQEYHRKILELEEENRKLHVELGRKNNVDK